MIRRGIKTLDVGLPPKVYLVVMLGASVKVGPKYPLLYTKDNFG
jgi:hypothetical protein